jgi:hypothetical protein
MHYLNLRCYRGLMTRLPASILCALTATSGLLITALSAPSSIAQPDDLLPYCSGNETPSNNNCRAGNNQVFEDSAPGANPGVPVGVDPAHDSVM